MVYFSTISFVNSTVSSNLNQIVGILQLLENNVLCSLLILLQLYLVFHTLCVIRDKKHITLEICIFFIFDFSERLIVLLFA